MPRRVPARKLSVAVFVSLVVGVACAGSAAAATFPQFLTKWGDTGTADGKFENPFGIVTSPNGEFVYVSECAGNRIQKFTDEGKFLAAFGKAGTGAGEMSFPYDVKVDDRDNIFVCEFGNSRIQVFDSEARSLECVGSLGSGPTRSVFGASSVEKARLSSPIWYGLRRTGNSPLTSRSASL